MKSFSTVPKLIFFVAILLVVPNIAITQDEQNFEMSCEIIKIYPAVSLSRLDLKEAQTLSEINYRYPASWVKEYLSVDIETTQKGLVVVSKGVNDSITDEQKINMLSADPGKDIKVTVFYMPDNTLSYNDPKEINFSISIDPIKSAQYVGGDEKLEEYLHTHIVKNMSSDALGRYQLAVVKFKINEDGDIIDPSIFWSSENEQLDGLMLQAICNMQKWIPAEYASGAKTTQEYALMVGDKDSCVINLLRSPDREERVK